MTIEDKLKCFVNEINDIKDEKLRKFAEELIGGAEDYFFIVPASSSGKYHPQFDLGDGGLIRHTRCVTFFAECMAESMDFNEHDKDLLIIAALAHDIRKQGDNTGHTVREHPVLASELILKLQSEHPDLINKEDAKKISKAVLAHMGKWEANKFPDPYPMPANDFEKALQAADYVASRKEILDFNFRDTEVVELPKDVVAQNNVYTGEPGDFVINFGKHKGKTIKKIHEMDKLNNPNRDSFIEWMVKIEDFHCKDAQEVGKKFLESLNKHDSTETVEEVITNENIVEGNVISLDNINKVDVEEEFDGLPF